MSRYFYENGYGKHCSKRVGHGVPGVAGWPCCVQFNSWVTDFFLLWSITRRTPCDLPCLYPSSQAILKLSQSARVHFVRLTCSLGHISSSDEGWTLETSAALYFYVFFAPTLVFQTYTFEICSLGFHEAYRSTSGSMQQGSSQGGSQRQT